MSIQKEYEYELVDKGRILTKCLIRIIEEDNKPIVVLCVQKKVSKGTTITNTIDLIAKEVFYQLKTENGSISSEFTKYLTEYPLSKKLKYIGDCIKNSSNWTAFIFHRLGEFFSIKELKEKRNKKINNIMWVEYYPADTSFFTYDKYAVITFNNEYWSPEWNHISEDDLVNYTGYPIDLFKIQNQES